MSKLVENSEKFIGELSREFSLLVGMIAVTGSLAASEIFGWETFTLSTLQRVFMYPLVLIIGAGIALNLRDLRKLVLPLSISGALTSFFHFAIVVVDPTRGCGFALPCSAALRYSIAGFSIRPMYLPLMAFAAFTIIMLITYRYEPKKK